MVTRRGGGEADLVWCCPYSSILIKCSGLFNELPSEAPGNNEFGGAGGLGFGLVVCVKDPALTSSGCWAAFVAWMDRWTNGWMSGQTPKSKCWDVCVTAVCDDCSILLLPFCNGREFPELSRGKRPGKCTCVRGQRRGG